MAIALSGRGYRGAPGIYDKEQTASWKRITDAVHAEGVTCSISYGMRAARRDAGHNRMASNLPLIASGQTRSGLPLL